ncbi:histidine kinase dimerization/phospho-acceptor domain-containing protein [Sphingomonas sp. STIS6.2]|uniref:histidine kinase dimerization/phospho-acceptor domain-containing protein n=1 Tax=Sphingomonas sp. STIS6.2 TaxID=1379700 RepID=UPI0004DB70BA|nr:histidine kinase dimerization/phospho-acceptor domain-containing protein [Sphingomonas sp. STIS6.2]
MRFDDSLKTVLSADMATDFGAQSAWRQMVDLIGRGRSPADAESLARLQALRKLVPDTVRAASARALAFAKPDVALVGFFAEDTLAIAAPVLRTAMLPADDWLALLPQLTPAGRSVLRHRRDLPEPVCRGLESFGSTDFVLAHHPAPSDVAPAINPGAEVQLSVDDVVPAPAVEAPAESPSCPTMPRTASPFVTLGAITRGLPVVAEALRHAAVPATDAAPEPVAKPERFEISDLVKRIDAFNRDRIVPDATDFAAEVADSFRYETDPTGVIRWVDGVSRTALVGASLAYAAVQGEVQIDGVAAGAYRRRSAFDAARLQIGGLSSAAGAWRISGVPAFDPASGRFTGFRGTARRPRRDEVASLGEPLAAPKSPVSDSLRQLVHELRTPTNAIAGFAELIETELLGPVPATYRERAAMIRSQASELLAAIEDLDTAARIEGDALELRPTIVPVLPLLDGVVRDLAPLAALRGAQVVIDPSAAHCDIAGDDLAVERLVGRLLATLVSACSADEMLMVAVLCCGDTVALRFDRPRAMAVHDTNILLSIDNDRGHERDGAPLLGTGFALRLAQNFAVELGGHMAFESEHIILTLPAVAAERMERVLDRFR